MSNYLITFAGIALGMSLAAFTLPAHAEYVKKPITGVSKTEAQCNMVALNAMNGMDIIYDYIIADTVKKNCMAAAGYAWKKPPRSAKAQRPAGTRSREK